MMRTTTSVRVCVFVAVVFGGGCSFSPGATGTSGSGGAGAHPPIGGFGGSMSQGPCQGLQCQQSTCKKGNCTQTLCTGGVVTRLTGKVYDPAGKVPLSNVDVFVPNTALADYTDGPACDTCAMALSGAPVVRAKTDATGSFTLGATAPTCPSGPASRW